MAPPRETDATEAEAEEEHADCSEREEDLWRSVTAIRRVPAVQTTGAETVEFERLPVDLPRMLGQVREEMVRGYGRPRTCLCLRG
ncbi:hypothetical protein [Streptomyces sp. NPDC101455]|uniref:hypothetical protein n=1 Tax=Streptomyces sp. NPDC101455 TaxID=3366142 RepID=UPI0038022571